MKKILAAILAALMIASISGCGRDDPEDTETEETYVPADVSDVPSPLKINGAEIPYALYRYYYAAVKYQYDLGNDSFWRDDSLYGQVRELTLYYIRRGAAVAQYAEQSGVILSDYDKSKAKQNVASNRYSLYEDDVEYYKALDLYYLTEETNLYLEEMSLLEEKLFEYLTSEESGPKISSNPELVRRFVNNRVIRVDHILIKNDEGEDRNENETLINELAQRIASGEDFYELKHKYSEDTENKNDDTGYYIAEGDKSPQFSDASFALREGETSGVVTAPYGYHIIRRLTPDEEYITENFDTDFAPLYRQHMFDAAVQKLIDAQVIEYDESYYAINPLNLK